MIQTYKIAVDMDGVLSDFARKVAEITKAIPSDKLSSIKRIDESILDKKRMWGAINYYDSHTPFFYSLDKLHDADLLMEFLFKHFSKDQLMILTASGTSPKDADMQKKRWIKKHYGDLKVEVVTKSKDKATFASENHILIDDRDKSIAPWVEAGGIGILHLDSISTIEKIKEIIGM